MTELNEIACLETARNARLCAGAEHYLKVIAELRAERDALKAENETLRDLVQCTECSTILGGANYIGWMPGICIDCQAEIKAEPPEQVK